MPYNPINIKYNLQSTFPGTAQRNWVGAQALPGRRGWWNNFNDSTGLSWAMFLDKARYLYYTMGNGTSSTLNVLDILLNIKTVIATFNQGGNFNSIFVDQGFIYLGGNFSSVTPTGAGATTRNNICRFIKAGYALDAWNPNCNNTVRAITGNPANNGGPTYCGGNFTQINGSFSVQGLAAFDTTGASTAWNPGVAGHGNLVNGMAYCPAGTTGAESIFIVGSFTTINSSAATNAGEITTAGSGSLTGWLPNLNTDACCVAVDNANQTVYMGGAFSTVNSGATIRNCACAFGFTGTVNAWNPNFSGGTAIVYAMLVDANNVYVGGNFTTNSIGSFLNVSIMDKSAGGANRGFNVPATGYTVGVRSLAVFDRTVYVGGDCTAVGACYPVMQGAGYGADLNAFPFPLLTNSNSIFVSKAGSDANAGTFASPVLTLAHALSLSETATYVVVCDNGVYNEQLIWNVNNTLMALDGFAPTIQPTVGAITGTYGARFNGRTKFSTGAGTTFSYVNSTTGNDSSGTRGNASLPFQTISAALANSARVAGDTIQIQDNGIYVENLAIGTKSVIIQAAAGFAPTLMGVSSAYHFSTVTSAVTLTLYGLHIVEAVGTTFDVIRILSTVICWDCSFSGSFGTSIAKDNNATTLNTYVNCSFIGVSLLTTASAGSYTYTLTNCFFSRNKGAFSMGGMANVTLTITGCTFLNIYGDAIGGGNSDNTTISNCYCNGVLGQPGTGGCFYNGTSGAGCTITNCWILNCDGPSIAVQSSSTNTIIQGCLLQYNCRNANVNLFGSAITQGDIQINSGSFTNPSFTIKNCVIMGSGVNGITISNTGGGSYTLGTVSNVSLLNNTSYGFEVYGGNTFTLNVNNIAEYGSGTASFACSSTNQAITINNSVYNTAIAGGSTVAIVKNSINANPQFVSTVTGAEDVSLMASSPGIGLSSGSQPNIGMDNPILSMTSPPALVDGLIFQGLVNMFSGIYEGQNMSDGALTVKFCTFGTSTISNGVNQQNAVSFYGVNKNTVGGEVSHCLFSNLGLGILGMVGSTFKYNVLDQCSGGGIVNFGLGATINNNSSYACPYGQYDGGLALDQFNNVYSDSSVYDYYGSSTQASSCIGTLSPDAQIDTASIQTNPLFVNPFIQNQLISGTGGQDLRLQALADYDNFNSPCLGGGNDGFDMGAFKYDYGTAVVSGSVLTLAAPNRNPDRVERFNDPIKLAEGENEDASTYSEASGFRRRYVFTWNQKGNDMPAAQTTALEAIFTTPTGQVLLDMGDGNGYLAATVMRASGFEFTDLTDLYVSNAVPLPVKQLELRMT